MCARDRIIRSRWSVVLAAVALAGCAHPPSPAGWLPGPRDAPTDAFGAWVRLDLGGTKAANPSGELLVAETDSIWILSQGRVNGRALASVQRVEMWTYAPTSDGLVGWTLLGVLSTVSHGYYLALSAPAWILVGAVASAVESRTGREFLVPSDLDGLRARARFPSGWPPDFDRRTIAGKRVEVRAPHDGRLDAWPGGP